MALILLFSLYVRGTAVGRYTRHRLNQIPQEAHHRGDFYSPSTKYVGIETRLCSAFSRHKAETCNDYHQTNDY